MEESTIHQCPLCAIEEDSKLASALFDSDGSLSDMLITNGNC